MNRNAGKRGILLASGLLLVFWSAGCTGETSLSADWRTNPDLFRVERDVYLMGTQVRLVGDFTGREAGLSHLGGLVAALEAGEAQLSTWRSDSLLSRLNRHPVGSPFELDPQVCRLFQTLHHWTSRTGSSFDPAVGRLLAVWDLRGSGRIPSQTELEAALETSGFLQSLVLDEQRCTVSRRRDAILDAGAFGKGEALDRALEWSRQTEPASWLIDLGGQITVRGRPSGEAAWSVGMAHPIRRNDTLLELALRSGSLATSGGSERNLTREGRELPHILDPRSGMGASFRGSVVVWHESSLVADILSTALFVLGPREGLAWAEENRIAACYLVPLEQAPESSPRILPSPRFKERFLDQH